MVLQNEKCTAVANIDESFVMEADNENYDVVFNPKMLKNNNAYSAVCVTAKTDRTIKIAVICEHEVEFSAVLNETSIYLTINGDAVCFDLKNGELLNYERDAVKDEFDFSELEKLLD